MKEEQRLSYLRNMGYQVYYPRAILPGAKPSPLYDQTDSTDSAVEPTMPKKSQAATASISSAEELANKPSSPKMADPETKVEEKTRKQELKVVTASAKEAEQIIAGDHELDAVTEFRFSLQYFALGDQLAVINEEPHQLRGRQNKDSLALLKAILAALISNFDLSLKAETFEWPLAEGLGDAEPERAARLALQGFIEQRHAQEGFSNLLVFTAQLGNMFRDSAQEELLGDIDTNSGLYNLTLSHSLHSMLAHPLLKREVWSHLQALRARLQN